MCLLPLESLLSGEPRYVNILLRSVPISSFCSGISSRLTEPFLSRQMTVSIVHLLTVRLVFTTNIHHELRSTDDLSTPKKKLTTYFS